MRKKYILMCLIIVTAFINIKVVTAEDNGKIFDYNDKDTETEGEPITPTPIVETTTEAEEGRETTCTFTITSNRWSKVYGAAYDSKTGAYITDVVSIANINYEQYAGGYIGIKIWENKGIEKKVSYVVTSKEIKEGYNLCTFNPSFTLLGSTFCIKAISEYDNSSQETCLNKPCYVSWAYISGSDDNVTPTPTEISHCYKRAKQYASVSGSISPSYTITYGDSNVYNGDDTYTASGSISCKDDSTETSGENGEVTKKKTCDISYSTLNTCLDVITGKVKYTANKCDKSKEIMVETVGECKTAGCFNYFIPLNTKAGTKSLIKMIPDGGPQLSKDQCEKYIDANEDHYPYVITYEIGKSFTGNKRKDKAKIKDGCYFQTNISLKVKQKFYGESEDGKSLEGYNFYYKPIDIYNPFPKVTDKTPMRDTSYWYDSYNKEKNEAIISTMVGKKTINISNAFNSNNLNYSISSKAIDRISSNDVKYTSWKNMRVSGTSTLIYDANRANVDIKAIYKLGCGPENKDWSECKK